MSHKYLDYIRELNKAKASKCHICKKQSTGINAYGYEIKFVCQDHYIPDNPNVIHRVYPDGMPYPKEMLDPDVGNFWGGKKEDIWATQVSFEE